MLNKFSKAVKPENTTAELAAAAAHHIYLQKFKETQEKYTVTAEDVRFACSMAAGKCSSTYLTIAFCHTHNTEISHEHLQECEHFL